MEPSNSNAYESGMELNHGLITRCLESDCAGKLFTSPDRRQPLQALAPLTPTANLKLLVKAASPELHSRDRMCRESVASDACGSKIMAASCSDVENINPTVPRIGDQIRRKDKSLGLLCQKFLVMYPMLQKPDAPVEIKLDELSRNLDVSRRRVYDIINVLEAVEFAKRLAKNRYSWHGNTNLVDTVSRLFNVAKVERVAEEITRMKLIEADLKTCSNESEFPSPCEIEKLSLNALAQKFFMLFLVAPQHTLNLDTSAKVILHDAGVEENDLGKFKTTIRRLYDIANILISLQLIRKLSSAELKSRKPVFVYTGPRTSDMIVSCAMVSRPARRSFTRHLSFDQICHVASLEHDRMSQSVSGDVSSVDDSTSSSSSTLSGPPPAESWSPSPSASSSVNHDTVSVTTVPSSVTSQLSTCRLFQMSGQRRHFTCFMRTKSEGSINPLLLATTSTNIPSSSARTCLELPGAQSNHADVNKVACKRLSEVRPVVEVKLPRMLDNETKNDSPVDTNGTSSGRIATNNDTNKVVVPLRSLSPVYTVRPSLENSTLCSGVVDGSSCSTTQSRSPAPQRKDSSAAGVKHKRQQIVVIKLR